MSASQNSRVETYGDSQRKREERRISDEAETCLAHLKHPVNVCLPVKGQPEKKVLGNKANGAR